ncbi:MAG: hypothetical protein OXH15_19450 [Gammaproteobacteria bacterium]|nr:hypothetical protein [Gammaproteobacteria bacterium]
MLKSDKLKQEQAEKRSRLAALVGKDELTDDERTEVETITARMGQFDTEIRAAELVEARDAEQRAREFPNQPEGEDAEARERRELRESIRLGNYVAAAIEQRAVDGREAEYNAAVELQAVAAFPLELLAPPPEVRQRNVEDRAQTAVDTAESQKRWLDRLFSDTAAMRVGVTFDSVGAGVAAYPVTTAGASAAQRAKSEDAVEAAWTIGVTDIKPTRNAVHLTFNEEDRLRIPDLEGALRRDLSAALTEGVDRAVFVGDAGSDKNTADIAGLTTAAGVVDAQIKQADKIKAAETLAAFLGLVDGKHASMTSDLRCVLTVGAHNLWAGTIANAAAENQTLLAFLRANGLACSVRGDIETATEAGDWGAFVGRARGLAGAGVAAVWNSASLIRDPYTAAKSGQVLLTLSHYWNFALPRASNFARVKFVAD